MHILHARLADLKQQAVDIIILKELKQARTGKISGWVNILQNCTQICTHEAGRHPTSPLTYLQYK
jgi:hypothetical protein